MRATRAVIFAGVCLSAFALANTASAYPPHPPLVQSPGYCTSIYTNCSDGCGQYPDRITEVKLHRIGNAFSARCRFMHARWRALAQCRPVQKLFERIAFACAQLLDLIAEPVQSMRSVNRCTFDHTFRVSQGAWLARIRSSASKNCRPQASSSPSDGWSSDVTAEILPEMLGRRSSRCECNSVFAVPGPTMRIGPRGGMAEAIESRHGRSAGT